MAGFAVTCGGCGREFSPTAERSFYDRDTRTYICGQCLTRLNITAVGAKKRGKTGSILRIVFGVLFILAAFSGESDDAEVTVTCILIGLGLLLWQFWPQLMGLLNQRKTQAAIRQLQEDYRSREAERKAREAARQKVCPHCGATGTGFTCEYCGMPLED